MGICDDIAGFGTFYPVLSLKDTMALLRGLRGSAVDFAVGEFFTCSFM